MEGEAVASRKVIRERLLTIPEVKELLEELGFEAGGDFFVRAYDYAEKFSKLEAGKARELVEKLVQDFGLTEREAVQLVNCMPETIDELRTFLSGHKVFISSETMKAILALLDEYRQG